ncbi:hypothetical protein PVAP13_4NG217900 [Panicum virgatum]|uniref:Uncharacterized protein n=1 Tax=Panicum virgatum TaxID=38727 RepID=A0A8T0TBD1_PANVG|nr:hypothetical protein PVAP13_4NG217900 [Panicum virgatum]
MSSHSSLAQSAVVRRCCGRNQGRNGALGKCSTVSRCTSVDGTGCPFWFWEEDYVEHLKKIGILNGGEWSRKGNIKDDEKMLLGNGGTSRKEEDNSVEVVRLLRSICMLCFCILVVQVVMLFVQLLKR